MKVAVRAYGMICHADQKGIPQNLSHVEHTNAVPEKKIAHTTSRNEKVLLRSSRCPGCAVGFGMSRGNGQKLAESRGAGDFQPVDPGAVKIKS